MSEAAGSGPGPAVPGRELWGPPFAQEPSSSTSAPTIPGDPHAGPPATDARFSAMAVSRVPSTVRPQHCNSFEFNLEQGSALR